MTFLKNAWYVLAWSREIGADPVVRTLLDTPVVAWRNEDGHAVALLDRCPHRFAPLSLGKRVGNNIRCGYHGLEFDSTGACVRNQFFNVVPSAARVRSFPLVEQDKLVWIWVGDAEPADVASIPRIKHHLDPEYRCVDGLTTAQADYRLLADNLMDLTHTTFLHPLFGGEDYRPKYRCVEDPDGSVVSDYVNERIPNFFGSAILPTEFVHHRDTIRWIAPATHVLFSHTTAIDGQGEVRMPSAHILTPETATSTHYFWSSAVQRDAAISDEDHLVILRQAFDIEDKPMVEAVQRRMGGKELWELQPVLLAADAGSVRVRRRLEALIEAERTRCSSR